MVMPQFGGIPGLPSGPQSFAPALTQEQLNQLSPDDLNRLQQQLGRAPTPSAPQFLDNFLERSRGVAGQAGQKIKQGLEVAGAALSALPAGRIGMLGGMISPAITAVEEAQAGRPTGALGAVGGGAAGVALGAGIAKMLPGPYGKIASLALPAIGGMLGAPTGASALESARQKATGEPTKGKEGEFSTQMAMNKQLAELGTTQYRDQMGVYTSAIRDLNRDSSNQAYLDMQRMNPLIQQMKNAELIRSQALINTQNQAYLQQGVVATAGALATGGQEQTGATVRQALATNPYNIALQSPAIRFG